MFTIFKCVDKTSWLSLMLKTCICTFHKHFLSFGTWKYESKDTAEEGYIKKPTLRRPFPCGDGTSGNDVSPYECSGTPGPQNNRPLWHTVPGLIRPCHNALYNTFRLVQNYRDVSMRGHCVLGTINLATSKSLQCKCLLNTHFSCIIHTCCQ